MAGRGRCWVCGSLLGRGAGVCDQCLESLEGWCSRCQHRSACQRLYAAAAERRRRAGLQPPSYPPCLCRPAVAVRRPQLERAQRRVYGAPLVGVVVLVLAAMDGVVDEERRRQTQLEADVVELARAWGARLRR